MLTSRDKHALRILSNHPAEEEKGNEIQTLTSLSQRGFVTMSPYSKSESGFVSRIISITDAGRAALERSEG
jgi:DNA-binding PadR family transcriptional regulator